MKLVINPILNKELKLGSRSIKMPIALAAYALVMTLLAVSILFDGTYNVFTGEMASLVEYKDFSLCFQILSVIQLVGICIIIPTVTASSIAGEREKQTLDIMLTTPVSPFSIVMGKLMAALFNVFLFIISGLPAMSLCFMYGGIKWTNLFSFFFGTMIVAFFVGAVGVWASAMFKKTVTSVIISFIYEVFFFIGTLVIFSVSITARVSAYYTSSATNPKLHLGMAPSILFLNPASGIFNSLFSAEAGYDIMAAVFGGGQNGRITTSWIVGVLSSHWTMVNYILLILMGFGFIALAALKIDSARRKSKKRS